MGDKNLFDTWSTTYNQDVSKTHELGEYPFCGYRDTINLIVNHIVKNNHKTVVDMGVGSGVLSKQLYDKGHFIIGVDFSTKMIDIAFDSDSAGQGGSMWQWSDGYYQCGGRFKFDLKKIVR